MKKKNRRTFLRLATVGIVSIFGIAWNKFTMNHVSQLERKLRIFPLNRNKTIAFHADYIIISKNESIRVLSAKCTHLGCTINKAENGRLLCPCHGSEFDLEGKVLKGPAYKNLEIIPAQMTKDGKQIEIAG
jgi:cytochrome b6-f complex iron-sulfur subunit